MSEKSFRLWNLSVLAPYFRLLQCGLSVRYSSAPRAAAWLFRPLVRPRTCYHESSRIHCDGTKLNCETKRVGGQVHQQTPSEGTGSQNSALLLDCVVKHLNHSCVPMQTQHFFFFFGAFVRDDADTDLLYKSCQSISCRCPRTV